ncbi:MAG: uroporphyrinogen-III synthase [Bacteroidetes bacterium]|nr:uroporphyrinogen-III synthase [Bacteroidota bacterium]
MKLFISKSIEELASLAAFCKSNHWTLNANSLIELQFNAEFKNCSEYDCICFGSKNAVNFYLSKYKIPHGKWIACVGSTTANVLIKAGYNPSFIGNKSGDTQKVAIGLRSFVGEKKCFFPVSDISLGSLHQYFSDSQKQIEVLYHTNFRPLTIEAADIYAFSSPSNVESFLLTNEVPNNATFIAWGQATAEKMEASNMKPKHILTNSQLPELIDLLSNLVHLK